MKEEEEGTGSENEDIMIPDDTEQEIQDKLVCSMAREDLEMVYNLIQFVEDARLLISLDGIHIRLINREQNAMINAVILSKEFTSYNLTGKGFMSIMDTEKLGKVIKGIKEVIPVGGMVNVEVTPQGFKALAIGTFNMQRELAALSDIEQGLPKEVKLDYDSSFSMPAGLFLTMLKSFEEYRSIKLNLTPERLIVTSRSDDNNTGIEFRPEYKNEQYPMTIAINCKEGRRVYLGMELLSIVKKALYGIKELVTVYVKTDCPVKIEFKFRDSMVSYYIAHRIDSD